MIRKISSALLILLVLLTVCALPLAGATEIPKRADAEETYQNIMTALTGETNAYTKYGIYASIAREAGNEQAARLFRATADAERIHAAELYNLAWQMDNSTALPVPDVQPKSEDTKENLLDAVSGETYENTEMYPAFIEQAKSAGFAAAERVFGHANAAEGVHAMVYQEMADKLTELTGETYYLCKTCGNIERGVEPETCPICGVSGNFSAF